MSESVITLPGDGDDKGPRGEESEEVDGGVASP